MPSAFSGEAAAFSPSSEDSGRPSSGLAGAAAPFPAPSAAAPEPAGAAAAASALGNSDACAGCSSGLCRVSNGCCGLRISSGEFVPETIFLPPFISPSTYGIFDFDDGSVIMSAARWSVKDSGASADAGFCVFASGLASTKSGSFFEICGGRISSLSSSGSAAGGENSANCSGVRQYAARCSRSAADIPAATAVLSAARRSRICLFQPQFSRPFALTAVQISAAPSPRVRTAAPSRCRSCRLFFL